MVLPGVQPRLAAPCWAGARGHRAALAQAHPPLHTPGEGPHLRPVPAPASASARAGDCTPQEGCLVQPRLPTPCPCLQAHTNNAVILRGRHTPSLESLSSPQRDDDAVDAPRDPAPAARGRLVRLHRARAARSAGASTPAARLALDLTTPAPTGLSDSEPGQSRALALISPATGTPAGCAHCWGRWRPAACADAGGRGQCSSSVLPSWRLCSSKELPRLCAGRWRYSGPATSGAGEACRARQQGRFCRPRTPLWRPQRRGRP